MTPKICEFVTDNLGGSRCGRLAPFITCDNRGAIRHVCEQHARALTSAGRATRRLR